MTLDLSSVKTFQFKSFGKNMKIKELRLGNLLLRNSKTETVARLSTTRINKNIASEYQGIEITEELLLKIGLIQSYDEEGNAIWSNENIKTEFYNFANEKSSFYITEALLFQTEAELKYLHQLQNLYFSLVAKELYLVD